MTKIDLYEMGTTQPTIVDATDNQRLDEALGLHDGDVVVLVDPNDDAEITQLDIARAVGDLAPGGGGLVVLRNPAATVDVTISYAGLTASVRVHAATRIRRLRRLAARALHLDDETAADTALRLPGATTDLPVKQPIGIYLSKASHHIALDLVHKKRPQG